ncbi:hypothetical protein LEM8419_01674 [Neolewinella maritima]|uniref:DUF2383 domain-containing protein n=1 Tax=Neolewinella maritima TaxID=1383882 RepID=A0ABN8F8K7_9BACT|nr:hypothetical protein [Neolewinella maritima]CAH1000521.1 hypothetical protein LEM8419_01674 [Neolewinella maritima]
MDQTPINKSSYDVRPEGTDGTINEIAMLHRQSAGYYRDIAKALKPDADTAGNYFEELAAYHEEMMGKLNSILADIAGGVHTPSRSSETLLKKQEAALNRALIAKNVSELSSLAHQNEQAISQSYEQALGNTQLLDFAEDILQAQHQEILVWVNRADRYMTVPQDRNEHYDDNDK